MLMEKKNPACWCGAEMKQEFHNQDKLWVCKSCWWNDQPFLQSVAELQDDEDYDEELE